VFSGTFDHSIDDKGRVSIPVLFREALQGAGFEALFVTNEVVESQPCLALYPPQEWERLLGRVKQKPSFNPDMQLLQFFVVGGAQEIQVDKQGRILIPPKLREYAGLNREVTFRAMSTHFLLWNKATFENVMKAAQRKYADPRFRARLGL
jgi:transcriptional regulator MraZ